VLFDLDGTLVDTAPTICSALNQMLAERGADVIGVADVRRWISLGADDLLRHALKDALGDLTADLDEFRGRLQKQAGKQEHLYIGVTALLSELRNVGATLAIVTNKPEKLARKLLSELSLDGVFAAVVGGDTLPSRKPDPATIRFAMEQLPPADQVVFVGDSIVDSQTAEAAGIRFYLFLGGYGGEEVGRIPRHAEFADHSELIPLLAGSHPIQADP
jgi:phosphoglycolate phosphatase